MINPNWIVPPIGVANDSVGDIFYYQDLVNGILTSDILVANDPIAFLLDIIAAVKNSVVVNGAATVFASVIMQKRAEILLALINSGKPNF